jgi:hypothetical protein
MNGIPFYTRMEHLQPKLHGLAVGMTLGMSSMFLNQGCPLLGQCPTCAACAPSLSLLVLPLLADGAVFLSAKVLKHRAEEAE